MSGPPCNSPCEVLIIAELAAVAAILLRIETIAESNSDKMADNLLLLEQCLTAIQDQPTGFRVSGEP